MKLQRQILTLYQEYHASPPSLFRLIRRNLGRYLLMLIPAAIAILLSYSIQRPSLGAFGLGLVIGALLRDLGTFIRTIRIWPIIESVIDWDRVQALLKSEASSVVRRK